MSVAKQRHVESGYAFTDDLRERTDNRFYVAVADIYAGTLRFEDELVAGLL